MTTDPIRSALAAAGCTREDARKIALRCGDHVRHRPTGEEWIVAWAEGSQMAPCGWPPCRASVADCDVINRASDEEHRRSVMGWWSSTSHGEDGRRAQVLRLYAAAIGEAARDA